MNTIRPLSEVAPVIREARNIFWEKMLKYYREEYGDKVITIKPHTIAIPISYAPTGEAIYAEISCPSFGYYCQCESKKRGIIPAYDPYKKKELYDEMQARRAKREEKG